MDKTANIHEKYAMDMAELLQRHVCGEITASEYAKQDSALTKAYVYECLSTGDHGCDALLARLEQRNRLSA